MRIPRPFPVAAFLILLSGCANVFSSNRAAAQPHPILILDGVVTECANLRTSPPGKCAAAEQVAERTVVRRYLVPRDSAVMFYGSRGAGGAHVVVTSALDLSRAATTSTGPMVQIVDGRRHDCPATRPRVPSTAPCTPPVPVIRPEQLDYVGIVRAPRSIELFGRAAVGGAIILLLHPTAIRN